MRLINTSTLELHDFILSEKPQYAILSHTLGDSEVTLHDMSLPKPWSKEGSAKIIQTCRLAQGHGLEFAWVDTCCIDKTSSAELTESINSMFQWYANAAVCYVFLADLPPNTPAEEGMASCRWFTRGWTLQELLAPKIVELYDMGWNYKGTKLDHIQTISRGTGILRETLLGQKPLASYSVAMRMSWAARRQTTRVEDTAYCLLGIFDVNMPLIYGEGLKAFRRLQEEIVKRNNDLTIFAWDSSQKHEWLALPLFATSPAQFVDSSGFVPLGDANVQFSVTNKGLLISESGALGIAAAREEGGTETLRYVIYLGTDSSSAYGGIYLRKLEPRLFYRESRYPLARFGLDTLNRSLIDDTEYYILIDSITADSPLVTAYRDCAVHVPKDDLFILHDTVPVTLWDVTDRVFLRPRPFVARYPMVLAMAFYGMVGDRRVFLVVLCD